jgi:hypothetical protein
MREPYIIRIQKSQVFTSSVPRSQVPGSAHPPVLVICMLQVAHFLWFFLYRREGDARAAVGRAVVDQQQLPIRVILG